MRQPSPRSKRIRLTLVAALAACSSLVVAAPALAQEGPECPPSRCAPPGHVFGDPVVTISSASYRQLPNTKGGFGDGRLSVQGVINPQGRPGEWVFQYSSKPDFVSAFGGPCGTHSGSFSGTIETYDSADHPVSASVNGSESHPSMKPECWISPQSQPSPLYVRLTYIPDRLRSHSDRTYPATNGCGGSGTPMAGTAPPPCYSNTLVVPFEFKQPGDGSSDKQLITALRGSLVPKGAAAKIGSILKKGFSTASFNAPSAGTAGVTWRAKKVVVAKGTSVSRAGKTTIKVKLTKRGKALLRRAKRARKRVKLKATGSFKPRGQSKVSTSRTITLK